MYKIGVIDFGIIYELDANYREVLFDVLTQMFEIPPRVSAIKLLNSCIFEPPGVFDKISNEHKERIIHFACEMFEEAVNSSKKANQLQIYKFLHTFKDYLHNSEIANVGIRPSDDFVKTQLVLAMAHGITLTLCKDEYMGIADKVINELFHTNILF
jgi:hypothetical protein